MASVPMTAAGQARAQVPVPPGTLPSVAYARGTDAAPPYALQAGWAPCRPPAAAQTSPLPLPVLLPAPTAQQAASRAGAAAADAAAVAAAEQPSDALPLVAYRVPRTITLVARHGEVLDHVVSLHMIQTIYLYLCERVNVLRALADLRVVAEAFHTDANIRPTTAAVNAAKSEYVALVLRSSLDVTHPTPLLGDRRVAEQLADTGQRCRACLLRSPARTHTFAEPSFTQVLQRICAVLQELALLLLRPRRS